MTPPPRPPGYTVVPVGARKAKSLRRRQRPERLPGAVPGPEQVARSLIEVHAAWWASEPLRLLDTAGTENWMLRLGGDKVVRLPASRGAEASLARELEWLPRLARALPYVAAPLPLAASAGGHRASFAVLPWIEGQDAWTAAPADETALATELGGFVARLRALPFPGPGCGPPGTNRGIPLAELDGPVRLALATAHEFDEAQVLRAWEACLAAPEHDGPARWFHGDLQPFNLILRDGRLAAVIDWGAMGTGDAACDLAPAWQVFGDPAARAAFLQATGAGEDERRRGKGWALAKAVEAIPYYRETNPSFAAFARRTLGRVLADPGA